MLTLHQNFNRFLEGAVCPYYIKIIHNYTQYFIRLGLKVALTHQNIKIGYIATAKPLYRETLMNRKGSREGEKTGRGQRQLKINIIYTIQK